MTTKGVVSVPRASGKARIPPLTSKAADTEGTIRYFAYTARIAPESLRSVAPGAQFAFIAHLPDWALRFSGNGNGRAASSWNGALPSVVPQDGATVWGAVFDIPDGEAAALHDIESSEGRVAATVEVIDRVGRRHTVVTHRFEGDSPDGDPSEEYVRIMLDGSRHWSLPAGWIAALQEHIGEF